LTLLLRDGFLSHKRFLFIFLQLFCCRPFSSFGTGVSWTAFLKRKPHSDLDYVVKLRKEKGRCTLFFDS